VRKRFVTMVWATTALAGGCAGDGSTPPTVAVTVHAYVAPPAGSDGSVNTYFVETAHGLVVIDGLRTLHEGSAGLVELQKIGKPIEAVILTHPHPDHVGGLGVFAAAAPPGTPVYGSAASRDEIAGDPHGYYALSVATMPGDFPAVPQLPTSLVADGQRTAIDGVDFQFSELGAGEAVSATLVTIPSARIAFGGDLTSDQMMPYLIEGRTKQWLAQLDTLEAAAVSADRIYPGHGKDGPLVEAVAAQRAYLNTFRSLVDQHRAGTGAVGDEGRAAIFAGMQAMFGDEPPVATVPELFNKNIDAVAQELAAEAPGP